MTLSEQMQKSIGKLGITLPLREGYRKKVRQWIEKLKKCGCPICKQRIREAKRELIR
jgi:hypothetical protein